MNGMVAERGRQLWAANRELKLKKIPTEENFCIRVCKNLPSFFYRFRQF